jgi:hypothetical protein
VLIDIQGAFNASVDGASPVTIINNTTDLDIPLVAFTSLSNAAHTINMTNLAAGTQTERFDVHYALVTVGDGNLS